MRSPTDIMNRIAELLLQDGFCEPTHGIYVKIWDKTWRGWLAVDPGSHLLIPTVGVFSDELLNMRGCALKKLGVSEKKRRDGPPLIQLNLQQLIEGDDNFMSQISWSYTGKALKQSVADDLVYCFRKKAYPYIDAHVSYAAVLDAVKKGRGSLSIQFYLPMILIKLGLIDDLSKLVDAHWARIVSADMSVNYGQYVNALLELNGLKA